MIEVRNLSKSYGNIQAIRDISFSAQTGDILGFLGPNGAGKTTTMRILTGYMPPSGGAATVAGFDVVRQSTEVRRRIGYLPERVPLYQDMIVRDYLSFIHELKGYAKVDRRAAVDSAAEKCGLTEVGHRIIGNLSRGYRQRVGLAQAILGDPRVIVLDEPTVGLDPAQVVDIRAMIRQLAIDRTIILSTHILPEVSALCNKVVIIHRGRIVKESSLSDLQATTGPAADMQLVVRGPREQLKETLAALAGVTAVDIKPTTTNDQWEITVQCRKDVDPRPRLAQAVIQGGWQLLEQRSALPQLEEFFLQATAVTTGDDE